MTTKQVVLTALIIAVVCALVVWWLESFERKRLVKDWHAFIEGWAPGQKAGGDVAAGG